MSDASELYDAILKGNAKKAEEVTKAALAANVDPSELVQKYMIPAMDEVGQAVRVQRLLRPRVADRRPCDEDLPGLDHAALGQERRRAGGPGRDRHRSGRPARHRQEPRCLDARRRRISGR